MFEGGVQGHWLPSPLPVPAPTAYFLPLGMRLSRDLAGLGSHRACPVAGSCHAPRHFRASSGCSRGRNVLLPKAERRPLRGATPSGPFEPRFPDSGGGFHSGPRERCGCGRGVPTSGAVHREPLAGPSASLCSIFRGRLDCIPQMLLEARVSSPAGSGSVLSAPWRPPRGRGGVPVLAPACRF